MEFRNLKIKLLVIFVIYILGKTSARDRIRFQVEKMIEWSNPKYMQTKTVYHNSSSNPYVNVTVLVLKQLDIVYLRTVAYLITGVGKFGKQKIIEQNMDLCNGRKGGNVISRLLYSSFDRFGNVTQINCPVEPNSVYVAYYVWLSEDEFPLYFPDTKFDIKFHLSTVVADKTVSLYKLDFDANCVKRVA